MCWRASVAQTKKRGRMNEKGWTYYQELLTKGVIHRNNYTARTNLGVSTDREQILRWLRLSWPEEYRGARCARLWTEVLGTYQCGTYQIRRLQYIWRIKSGRLGRQAYMPPDLRRRRVANCETQNIPLDQFRAKKLNESGPQIGGHFPAPILGPQQ